MEFQAFFLFRKIKTIHIPREMNASVDMSISHLHMYTHPLNHAADTSLSRWGRPRAPVGAQAWSLLGVRASTRERGLQVFQK